MTNDTDPSRPLGFFKRLRAKLNQGPAWLTADLTELLPGRKIDAGILDDLETRLITADVGAEATRRILDELRKRVDRKELNDVDALLKALQDAMLDILKPVERPLAIDPNIRPYVILVVGINGSKEAVDLIKVGKMLATGEFNGFVIGCLSTEIAARVVRKQPVPKELVVKPVLYDKTNYEKYQSRIDMKECPTIDEEANP